MSSRPDNRHQSYRKKSRSVSDDCSPDDRIRSERKPSRRAHRYPESSATKYDDAHESGDRQPSRRKDDVKRAPRRSRSRSPHGRHHREREGQESSHRSRRTHRRRSRSRSAASPDPRVRRRRSQSRSRDRSRSPRRSKKRRSASRSRSPLRRAKGPLPSQDQTFEAHNTGEEAVVKKKPNYGNTGLLAKEANTVIGTNIVLKYHEPAEARKPPASQDWRLFIFKGDDVIETVPLSQRTCWLMGKEAAVVDLVVEHPSASKQHAVIQFRYVEKVINEYGDKKGKVKPYIIDLNSSNGTVLNGDRIGSERFVEVRNGDVMKIGSSEREYVFMLPPKE